MQRNNAAGISLIELLVAVAIVAILLAIAFPNFEGSMRRNRLATTTNELLGSVALARSEAIRNTRGAGICASAVRSWMVLPSITYVISSVAARCTALVSNPPYLPESDRQQVPPEVNADPGTALFAGPDGLAVARRLARQAFRILPGGALLALELDPRNVHEFAGSLVGWKGVRVERDLAGRQRFVLARR